MPELATAWISLAISAEHVQRDLRREIEKADDGTAKTVGRRIGQQLGDGVGDGARGGAEQVKSRLSERLGTQVGSVLGKGIGAGIKVGMAGAATAAAAAVGGIGVALKKGFDRLEAIDQAKFKLQALGNDAGTTAKIMDNALASVKGTAFGLQDAATAAASAVAAGIKPGQDLTKYLSEVGDAAAVAGTNFEDMGSIFNKIQTSNKAYTDDLQQLSDRGLPIFQWLQKEYGVTADKLSDMVQKGEVDSAHFQDAIDKNIGGAAQKMGQSFDGAVDNMEASVARLGANFITAILGGDPANALAGPTEAIGLLTTKFDQVGIWVNSHRAEIHGFFEDVRTVAVEAAGAVKSIGTWLVENKTAAETLATVFVAWKVTSALGEAATAAKGVATALGLIGPAAETAGATASTALAGITAPAWLIALLAGGSVAASDAFNKWSNDHPELQRRDDNGNTVPGRESQGGHKDPNTYEPIPGGGGPGAQPQRRGDPLRPGAFDPTPIVTPGSPGPQLDPNNPFYIPRRATGGSVAGAGTATSDSIPSLLSNGEHVWTADEVNKVGGQGAMYRLRAAVRGFAGGGMALGLPLETDDGRVRRNAGPGSRTRNRGPGNNPNEISVPDWSQPGTGWGGAPDWWWSRPIDPNDVLFPDLWGQNPWGQHPLEKKRIRPLGFAGGGAVTTDVVKQFASQISGGRYVRGGPPGPTGTDCSGAQAWIANFLTGGSGRFSTGNEGAALTSRGFTAGDPPPGVSAYWVGWKNGGPGGGHTAGTILDPNGGNMNVEMGGASGGGAFGGMAAGASSFPNRAWIPIAGGEDPNASSSFSGAQSTSSSSGGSFGGGSSGSGGGFDGQSLGQLIGQGLTESLSVPGFMNLLDSPNAKSAEAGLNYALGLLGVTAPDGPGGGILNGLLGGVGINLPSAKSQSTTPLVDPNTTVHGQANGAAPGPTFNVTANGLDPKAVVQKQNAAFNQAYRSSGLPAVRPS